ncbi:MAG: hypothetical protein JXR65_12645 [Bacteroidales bacterium]|nr:hypothetical protein [Bacteroidales bacterium]
MTDLTYPKEIETNKIVANASNNADFFQKAGKLCFFFQVSDVRQQQRIKSWLSEYSDNFNFSIVLLGVGFTPDLEGISKEFTVFSKKDFDFFGRKGKRMGEWVQHHYFDTFISFDRFLYKKGIEFVKSVNSKIKIGAGRPGQSWFYDLNIEYSKSMSYADFFTWAMKYFLELNIKL